MSTNTVPRKKDTPGGKRQRQGSWRMCDWKLTFKGEDQEKQIKAGRTLELIDSQGGSRKTQQPPLDIGGYLYGRKK